MCVLLSPSCCDWLTGECGTGDCVCNIASYVGLGAGRPNVAISRISCLSSLCPDLCLMTELEVSGVLMGQ